MMPVKLMCAVGKTEDRKNKVNIFTRRYCNARW